jgi:transcriptional regulator with XRE-family HTH domain
MTLERLSREERAAMARRLRAARYANGATVQSVADATGVHVNSVMHWERGGLPHAATRPKVAAFFDLDEDFLFAEIAHHRAVARELLAG